MFRSLDDFHGEFRNHRESTLKILSALSDESLRQRAAEGHRTLGGMAWHIVTSIPEMMNRTGLALSSVDAESMPPKTAAEIVAAYEAAADELEKSVRARWTDASLAQLDDMYGMQWPRGLTLSILLDHEIHHRGQMTVLMRQAGLKVPGIFGPAKEEWREAGMPEPPY